MKFEVIVMTRIYVDVPHPCSQQVLGEVALNALEDVGEHDLNEIVEQAVVRTRPLNNATRSQDIS